MNRVNPAGAHLETSRLTAEFLGAVSFEVGEVPKYEIIPLLFIEAGLLIKNTASPPEISSPNQFIELRQTLVDSGELTCFHEAELSAAVSVFGNVAHRFSVYTKSGTTNGVDFAANGIISTQFINTPQGWRISSMAWDDERPGLALDDLVMNEEG